MDNTNSQAFKKLNTQRFLGKILQFIARKMPFIPGKLRVKLQALRGVKFIAPKTTFIGENVYFDDIYPELIFIGKNVAITEGACILSHFYDTSVSPTPHRFVTGKVIIEDNVFIGMNAVIAKPVTIGEGSVIGANSVVTKDIEPFTVVGGVPAKKIAIRTK